MKSVMGGGASEEAMVRVGEGKGEARCEGERGRGEAEMEWRCGSRVRVGAVLLASGG